MLPHSKMAKIWEMEKNIEWFEWSKPENYYCFDFKLRLKIIPIIIFIFAKGKCLNVWEGKAEKEEKRSNRGNTIFEITIKTR